jgi:subtilase family serine protease
MGRMRFPELRRIGTAVTGTLMLSMLAIGSPSSAVGAAFIRPAVSDFGFVTASETPPTEAQCFSVDRRCFAPAAIQTSYNLGPLYAQGNNGAGHTIAVVDSFGSLTIAHDLHVFDQAFGLQPMCGEEGVTCQAGMPTFSQLHIQGFPPPNSPPPNHSPGQEARNLWALEISLDVEWAHSVAPGANIILVTSPTAETLGVQGFKQFMNAEDYVIKHHLADVISQSFGSGEEAFSSTQSLLNLRFAFQDAQAGGVTMLASSGDLGSAESKKSPVGKGGTLLPTPGVGWPGSDPLVTGVGGTYLCTDPLSGTGVDITDPREFCQVSPGQREI